MTLEPDAEVTLPARARWLVDHWGPATERPRGLVEIELPYGRFLYVLPLGKAPVRYAGYTLRPAR